MTGKLLRSWLFAACLILLAAAPLAAQPATPAATPAPFPGLAPEVFQRARSELDAGNYGAARLYFSVFLALNPDYSQAYFGQALSLLNLEQLDEALMSIDRALETAPNNPAYRAAVLRLRSQIYGILGQPDEALADLSAAIELSPSADAYAERAGLLAGQEDYRAALADLNAALELTPDDPSLLLYRALLHRQLQDQASAAADYLQYINAIGTATGRNSPLRAGEAVLTELEEGLVQVFTFEGRAGQTATIIAEGRPEDPVDPLIVLIGPSGQPLAGDDDSGGGLTSLIRNLALSSDGTYTVLLSHAMGGSNGQVAIVVQLAGGAAPTSRAPTPTPGP